MVDTNVLISHLSLLQRCMDALQGAAIEAGCGAALAGGWTETKRLHVQDGAPRPASMPHTCRPSRALCPVCSKADPPRAPVEVHVVVPWMVLQ